MTIRLAPEQEPLVRSALSKGLAHSAEEFVSDALRARLDDFALDPAFETWVREEAAPGHDELLRDPSSAKNSRETLGES